MTRSVKVIDLRKGSPRSQTPLFTPRSWHEPERPKRRTSLRTKRRKGRAIVAFVILLLLAGLVGGMAWVSYLPQFSINSIAVAGAEHTPAALIQNYVESILHDGSRPMFSRSNVLLYPREHIERSLENFFPRIKSAQVSRESLLATAIMVAVEERNPYAQWCAENECYLMDEEGFIFDAVAASATSSILATQYVFRGGLASSSQVIGQRFAAGHLPGILVLLKLLGQGGFSPLGGSIENDQDFVVRFNEGFAMKFSFGQDAQTLTKNLQLVLGSEPLKGKESQLEYIDLRFDNRVYYKLRGETEVENVGQ